MAKRKVKGKSGLPYNMFKGEGESMNMLQKSDAVANNAFGSSNLGGTIGSIGSGITSIAQAGMNNAQIADTSSIQDQIKAQNNMVVGASDNDSLLSEWSSLSMLKDNYSWKDVRGGSNANRAMNTIGGAARGAMTGATVGGPIGAIAGAVIGLGSGIAGWITGNKKAKRRARRLNQQASAANQRALTSFENRASDIDTQSDLTMASNYFDYGGPIFSTGAIGYDLASRDLNNKQMKALGDMRLASLPNSFNAMPDVSTINTFKDGGIFIKPENRGKFTALKERTGKSSIWYKEHGTPAQKKMATFALNAAKWKHEDGGYMNPTTEAGILAKTALQLADPTGISSYPDLYNSGVQFYNNPSLENLGDLGLNLVSSLPMIGKVTAPFKAAKTAKLLSKLSKINTAKKAIKTAAKVNKKIDTFSELIPGVRPLAEKTQDITTKLISDPLFNRVASKNKIARVNNYRNFNLGIDLLNTTNTGADFYQGVRELNKKAFGGNLITNGAEWDNGLTIIGNGGTHEENPMEGVQIGIDPQGVPNLVEEGEVIFNDYVFSNRMKVPKAIRQKYKLRDNITFAEAAKKLSKESEDRPNDPISKRGLESFMSALANGQEEVRIKNEDRRMNRYAKGGKLGKRYEGDGPDDNYMDFGTLASPISYEQLERMINLGIDGSAIPLTGTSEEIDNAITRAAIEKGATTDNKSNMSYLRYAPALMSGISAFTDLFSKPNYSAADRIASVDIQPALVSADHIGQYLSYRPLDRMFYINQLNKNTAAGRRAIQNTSGGNRAAAMAGILAADYNYGENLGQLARQAEEYNQAQKEKVAGFNRQTDMFNSQQSMQAQSVNAQSRNDATKMRLAQAEEVAKLRSAAKNAYDTRRSNNLNNFINNLGNIGWEEYQRELINSNPALYYNLSGIGRVGYKGNGKKNGGKLKKN